LDYDQLDFELQELSGLRLLKVDRAALILSFLLNVGREELTTINLTQRTGCMADEG
jgi:hypothetical protein